MIRIAFYKRFYLIDNVISSQSMIFEFCLDCWIFKCNAVMVLKGMHTVFKPNAKIQKMSIDVARNTIDYDFDNKTFKNRLHFDFSVHNKM